MRCGPLSWRSTGVDATLQDLPIVTFYERRFEQLRRLGAPVAPGYYVILTRRGTRHLFERSMQRSSRAGRRGVSRRSSSDTDCGTTRSAGAGCSLTAVATSSLICVRVQRRPVSRPKNVESRTRVLLRRLPLLVQGALITILLSVTSMPLAIVAGLLVAIGRLYGPRLLRYPLGWYVEIIRGTPLVLQLYLIFFLLPEFGLSLPALVAAILGLSLNYAAYEAEIYRAGLQAIPPGQLEAALSLGMSRVLALRRIIVPQAVRLVIPPVTNDFIALFKDTAVCSVITVVELSKQYYIHAQSTGAVIELGCVTALFYMAMSYPLSVLVRRLERRLAAGAQHD